jgi:hypothetical protein
MAFFLNTNVMINFFQNLALFRVKNAKFVRKIFRRKYLKIITSAPGHPAQLSVHRQANKNKKKEKKKIKRKMQKR